VRLLKGVAISLAAAAGSPRYPDFGVVLFAGPVLWTACLDAREGRVPGTLAGVLSRAAGFAVSVGAGVGVVLLPLLAGADSTSHSPDSDSSPIAARIFC